MLFYIIPPSLLRRGLLHWLGPRANLLFRLHPSRCLQVLVSDVTEICFRGGKGYLAVHLDEYGKLIWGWCLFGQLDGGLVLDSFHNAVRKILKNRMR